MTDADMTVAAPSRIWVGGLTSETKEDDVLSIFKSFGTISDVKIRTSAKDIYCFLNLTGDAEGAIKALDQSKLLGKTIKVANAKAENGRSDRRRSPPRRSRSTSRRRYRTRSRSPRRRSRTPRRDRSRSAGRSTVPQGRVKLRIENLPPDMSWQELKTLGQDYASSTAAVTFSRTWKERGIGMGVLEFTEKREAEKVKASLNEKRIEGCDRRLVVEWQETAKADDEIPRRRR